MGDDEEEVKEEEVNEPIEDSPDDGDEHADDSSGESEDRGEPEVDELNGDEVEDELAEDTYKISMRAMLADKRAKEHAMMATLKPIKVKAPKKKKSKGKVTLTALRPVPGDLYLMEHHLIDVKVKQK